MKVPHPSPVVPRKRIARAALRTVALCTLAFGTSSPGRAEEPTAARGPGPAVRGGGQAVEGPGRMMMSEATSQAETGRPASYAIGDKLKIMVFEQLHPEARDKEERRDIVASAVERSELSGEYVVQEDGNIYVPLTGAVAVAGMSFRELDRALSETLSGRLNGVVRVGIQLLEREPVYVLGSVARPGPYKHTPGMSVLHVLALAGAVDTVPQDRWRLLDTAREKERLLKSSERLTRSLARMATLLGERDAAPDGSRTTTKHLFDLVGTPAGQARLVEADAFRQVERSKRTRQEAAIEADIASYQGELTIQRTKLTQVESNIGDRILRFNHLSKLRERGATTDVTYYASLTDLGDARERIQDSKSMVAQTEHRISDLRHAHLRLAIDADVDREREIRELQGVIDEEELTRALVSAALTQLPGALGRDAGGGKDMGLTILHRTPWGLKRRAAQEDSILEPGDVLQIAPVPASRVASQ